MNTLVIEVKSVAQSNKEIAELLARGGSDPTPRLIFVTYDLFHRMLAPNRMAVVKAMSGSGPLSIREIARRLGRDFKGVHTDVTALAKGGVIRRTDDGKVEFPYDRIHFDFDVEGEGMSPAA
jgi:predicted transcriptional regulator